MNWRPISLDIPQEDFRKDDENHIHNIRKPGTDNLLFSCCQSAFDANWKLFLNQNKI